MTIYDYLGVKEEDLLKDYNIPQESIIESLSDNLLKRKAIVCFRNIENISLKLSINRGEHYLQVIEIKLKEPSELETIAYCIQKAIKYRILFVFEYDERYLVCWRSFNLTQSTENVYTTNTMECTSWIYNEYLDTAPLLMCNVTLL